MLNTDKPLKKFRVLKREVWVQTVEVEAASEREAIASVYDGHGDLIDGSLEYSHDMERRNWTAEEVLDS